MSGGVLYIQSLRNQCHTKGHTCSTFYIWHMWNCITLKLLPVIFIDIQDNVIVKGMGKLSMPVVPGNLISLPNFLGMHSVQ